MRQGRADQLLDDAFFTHSAPPYLAVCLKRTARIDEKHFAFANLVVDDE
jgi:hypothetical protein